MIDSNSQNCTPAKNITKPQTSREKMLLDVGLPWQTKVHMFDMFTA